MSKHLLLFASTTGYQIRVFAEAARRIGAEVTLATDRCHIMDDPWGDRAIPVKFDRIADSLEVLRSLDLKVDGVAAVGDKPAILAAEAAAMYGVPFHPPSAAWACHDKHLARQLFQAAGMRVPAFFRARSEADAARAPYPCVLKPLGQSASKGVIRADDPREFAAAFRRISRMGEDEVQVEAYIPGREFAIEGLVTRGRLQTIAIFDKPDPLEGPFFEETVYVTPSREPQRVQQELIQTTQEAIGAIGFTHGPVHAEVRYNEQGAWILEAHARPIGGLCSRALRMADAVPLEEMILVHAFGGDVSMAQLDGPASGVMMIPTPANGLYRGVEGIARALAVPLIEDVVITATEGQHFEPPPEGSSYLGFIFARGETPEDVERALRQAHRELKFEFAAALETLRPSS
ncbi:MAG TPA: ATP-grasp domain-containing protein [Candidatus Acidoferrales bacterium]|nr:ATP-grasp domain-containing protein [Candidatus Acidoferrales bacterium]